MKKILTVSLVAMMAVTAARAEIASKAYVDQQDKGITDTIGSLSALSSPAATIVAAINAIDTTSDAALKDVATATGDANGVVSAVGKDGTDVTVTKALISKTNLANTLVSEIEGKADSADLGDLAALDEVAEANLASALATKINNKADSSDVTTLAGRVTTNEGAITTLNGDSTVTGSVDNKIATAQGTLNTAINGKQDKSTIANSLGTADGSWVAAGALATKDTVAKTDLAQGVQDSLGLADSALQQSNVAQTYDASGTAPVSGAAVASAISGAAGNYAPSTVLNSLDGTLGTGNVATGNVVTEVTQEDGNVTVTHGNAVNAVANTTGNGNVITAISLNSDGKTIDSVKGITALQQSDVAQTYSATGTAPVSGAAVKEAIDGVTTTVSNLDLAADAASQGSGNAIVSVSQSDGQLSATKGNVLDKVGTATGNGNVVTAISENADGQTIDVVLGITALQQSDVAQTYSATGTAPVSGAAVKEAIDALDGSVDTALALKEDKSNLKALAYKNTVGTNDIDANAVTLGKLSASLPSACRGSGAECVLKSSSGALAWEVIQRATGETPNNTTGSNAQ